jgi:hypothetical protein
MSYVGTWQWAQETNGTLRRGDRIRLIGQGVMARLARVPSQWRSRLLGENASQRGASEERARGVAEAISLHLNVTLPARLGPEANLLSKGVSLDVVGRRLHQIAQPTLRRVAERWPRGGFAEELISGAVSLRPGQGPQLISCASSTMIPSGPRR